MDNLKNNYKKYRWFFTSSDKLVIGGKSAEQNDFLLQQIKESQTNHLIMHTSDPGSPFTIILTNIENINNKDIEECAIFTACFSKAWKKEKKKALVDIFYSSQLYKEKNMKQGTWGVFGKVKHISVPLRLVLAKQKNILRAVPEKSVKNKKLIIFEIIPGSIPKDRILNYIQSKVTGSFKNEELLSALPSGSFKIINK